MKEDITALVLRHIPERVPHTKSELADIYLTESNKIETDRMKSRERKRDDDEVVKSRYDSLIADKEAQLTELQNEIEKLRREMFGQLLYASLEEEHRNQELADRRKVLDMWFETMRNRIEKTMSEKRVKAYLATDYDGSSALFFSKPKCYHVSEDRVYFYSSIGKADLGNELLADIKPEPNEIIEVEIVVNKLNG